MGFKMKKILIGYLSSGVGSGVNKYIDSLVNQIKDENIQIDFLTKCSDLEKKDYLIKGNYNKLHVISKNRKPLKQLKEMIKIFKENKYDIAYFNISETFNCIGIIAAKICKVKQIIIHSHSSGIENNNIIIRYFKHFLNYCCKIIVSKCGNTFLACSANAAKWMFSKEIIKNENYRIIYNKVDYDKFKYNEEKRREMRDKLNIQNKFVIGHVGRFSFSKNQFFLMDVLKEVFNEKNDAIAIIIGDGKMEKKIKEYANKLHILDKIMFLNNIDNINDYMQAFDIFLLPSRFEGLPIVGIEGQFSGLPCLFSDKISEDVIIGNNSYLLPINNVAKWKNKIISCTKRENNLIDGIAQNYMKNCHENQCKDIINNGNNNKKVTTKLGVSFWLKFILAIHFLLNITSYANGFNYLTIPSAVLIILILVFSIKDKEKIFSNKKYLILGTFLISYFFTLIVKPKYNILESIKVFVWSCIHFFFVFGYWSVNSKEQARKELKYLVILIILLLTTLNCINLIMLFNKTFMIIKSFEGELHIVGLTKWGRFYGIFYDPNYASVLCVCTIIFALYLLKDEKIAFMRLLLVFSIVVQLLYIYFCESRTGLLTLLTSLLIYFLLNCYLLKNKLKKVFYMTILFVFLLMVVAILPKVIIQKYNNFMITHEKGLVDSKESTVINENKNSSYFENETTISEDVIEKEQDIQQFKKNVAKEEQVTVGRNDNKQDISNRRFDIWKSGSEIFGYNLICGVGFSNILYVAREKYPSTYIVSNDFKEFNAFHNMFIDIGVSQGIIGLTILFIFLLLVIIDTRKEWKKMTIEDSKEIIMLVSCLLGILLSSMLLSEIFYINNVCTFLFWLLLGYYNYYLDWSKNGK